MPEGHHARRLGACNVLAFDSIDPERGATSPEIARSVCFLPAPLAPI